MKFFDVFELVLMITVPVYLVVRFNVWGILLGGGFSWILGILAGMLLATYRGGNIGDGIWIFFGLPFCLLYSVLIYGLKRLYLWVSYRSNSS